jgi:hypothetical protein
MTEKAKLIEQCLENDDLWQLRELALSEGGLLQGKKMLKRKIGTYQLVTTHYSHAHPLTLDDDF